MTPAERQKRAPERNEIRSGAVAEKEGFEPSNRF